MASLLLVSGSFTKCYQFGCYDCKTHGRLLYFRYLTNEGIEYLRSYLHLPSEIVPSTLKRNIRSENARPRAAAAPRGDSSKAGEDRSAYRRAPGGSGAPDKKADVGAGAGDVEFVSSILTIMILIRQLIWYSYYFLAWWIRAWV